MLKKRLAELPKKVANKGARAAIQAGSKPILDTEKSLAPVDSGLLRKSLGRKVKQYKGGPLAIVGPRKGFEGLTKKGRVRFQVRTKKNSGTGKGLKQPSRYAHLAEKKTSFVIASYEKNKATSVEIVGKVLGDFIEANAK